MSDITDNQELMDAFYEEAQNMIGEMRKDLSILGEGLSPHGEPREQSSTLSRLFRCAHTFKSSSGVVGFDDLHEVAQALEKIFKEAKDEKLMINADVVSILSDSIEVCQNLLHKGKVVDYKVLLTRLNNFLHP
jgi:two-component system chemotaxis sensor kinase CheA